MTEAEALDEAARAAGWRDWKTLQLIARPDKQDDIRRHAKTIMENAALKAENERLREAVGILEDGLQEVGDDYPGSSCQEWCQHQIKQARAALKEIEGD